MGLTTDVLGDSGGFCTCSVELQALRKGGIVSIETAHVSAEPFIIYFLLFGIPPYFSTFEPRDG